MSGEVFINYRGEDSHSYGALLYTELCRHFGTERVFLDSESIPAGADFAEQLLDRVRGCRVLLAVIGRRWHASVDAEGRRRIEDPHDWIRRELVEAFAAGVRVIPVLTDGASMPAEADLPTDIARLGRCQYRRLRHREATADLDRLRTDLTAADPALAAAARSRLTRRRVTVFAGYIFAALAILTLVIIRAATNNPVTLARLKVVTPPPPQTWRTTAGLGCVPHQEWRYHFDDSYRGEVYAQIAASLTRQEPATVTMTWGHWRWTSTVLVEPGMMQIGQGGTLLRFNKTDQTSDTPEVILDSTTPLCAVFGTASERPAPLAVIDTPGWSPL